MKQRDITTNALPDNLWPAVTRNLENDRRSRELRTIRIVLAVAALVFAVMVTG